MNTLIQARLFRDAADVKRYHTRRTIRTQSIGAHSFNMMLLIQQVAPDCRKEVLLACMYHDLPEYFTGDMPGDFKKKHIALGEMMDEAEKDLAPLYQSFLLTLEEEALVKWADRMEGALWCMEEMRMGNAFVAMIVENYLGWILASKKPFKPVAFCPAADELTEDVIGDATELGCDIQPISVHERN